MSNTISLPRDVSSLLVWLEGAPPGTLVVADELAERIRSLPVTARRERENVEIEALRTARQVAEWFDVDIQRVYRMAREGRLPSIRLGDNTLRFHRPTLERWLKARQK